MYVNISVMTEAVNQEILIYTVVIRYLLKEI